MSTTEVTASSPNIGPAQTNRSPRIQDPCDYSNPFDVCNPRFVIPRRAHSNFTEDSSPSSTYSTLYKTNQATNSRSASTSVDSIGRSGTTSIPHFNLLHNSKFQFEDVPSKDSIFDFHGDFFHAQGSNSSPNEEVVKVTNALTLDMAYVNSVPPLVINDFPDVIRPQVAEKLDKIEYPALDPDTEDQGSTSQNRSYASMGVQTAPVLIIPLTKEEAPSGSCSQEVEDIKTVEATSTSMEKSGLGSRAPTSQLAKSTRDSTGGPLTRQETRTVSEVTACSRERENTCKAGGSTLRSTVSEAAEGRPISEVIWGDVYNDIKHGHPQSAEEVVPVERGVSKAINKGTRLRARGRLAMTGGASTGGDEAGTMPVSEKPAQTTEARSRPRPGLRRGAVSLRLTQVGPSPAESLLFQKVFELQQFDDIVRSYLRPSDRRVRSVCSKTGSAIRMHGPIVRTPQDQAGPPARTVYLLAIHAADNERLDKAVKCLQETFPAACLNEKFCNQFYLQLCGDEIPI